MTGNGVDDLWHDEQHAYGVVTSYARREIEWSKRSTTGLSHVEAMTLAEELRRDGEVVTVVHVVGNKSYEVDRFPAR